MLLSRRGPCPAHEHPHLAEGRHRLIAAYLRDPPLSSEAGPAPAQNKLDLAGTTPQNLASVS